MNLLNPEKNGFKNTPNPIFLLKTHHHDFKSFKERESKTALTSKFDKSNSLISKLMALIKTFITALRLILVSQQRQP
jgi:hypothetical protein